MNFRTLCLSLLAVCAVNARAEDKIVSTYYQEFKTFENSPEYQRMLTNEGDASLQSIQKDIGIFKELSFLQRLVRFFCFSFDVVIVTPANSAKTLWLY